MTDLTTLRLDPGRHTERRKNGVAPRSGSHNDGVRVSWLTVDAHADTGAGREDADLAAHDRSSELADRGVQSGRQHSTVDTCTAFDVQADQVRRQRREQLTQCCVVDPLYVS